MQAAAQDLIDNPPPDLEDRLEFPEDHCVYTIDDAETTEIDDGLAVETLGDGRVVLWVHISDPTRWVTPDHALAVEAARRTKTVYLPTGALFKDLPSSALRIFVWWS